MTPNCQVRDASTVAQQALFFLNDQFVVDASLKMAKSLATEFESQDLQIQAAFVRLFACPPTQAEQQACLQFVQSQTEVLEANEDVEWKKKMSEEPGLAARTAMASLCQSLMASNRFLYVQ